MRTLRPGLSGEDPLATIRLPQMSLSSQSLGICWYLNQNNQKTEHIATKTNNIYKGALINNNTIKHAKIYDRQS